MATRTRTSLAMRSDDLAVIDSLCGYLGRSRSEVFRLGVEVLRLRALLRMIARGDVQHPTDPDELDATRRELERQLAELKGFVYDPVERPVPNMN